MRVTWASGAHPQHQETTRAVGTVANVEIPFTNCKQLTVTYSLITRLQSPSHLPFHLCTYHPSTPSLRFIHLSAQLSTHQPTHPFTCSYPVHLLIHLLIHPSRIYLSIHLSIFPWIHSSAHPAFHHPSFIHSPSQTYIRPTAGS